MYAKSTPNQNKQCICPWQKKENKKWIGLWMSRYIVSKNPLDMIVFLDRLNSSICVIRAKLTNEDNTIQKTLEKLCAIVAKSPFKNRLICKRSMQNHSKYY